LPHVGFHERDLAPDQIAGEPFATAKRSATGKGRIGHGMDGRWRVTTREFRALGRKLGCLKDEEVR
jgi:hypothetical protein